MNKEAKQLAVELRQAGVSVREAARRSGLSTPTVVAVHKAFLEGGMAAVLARKPGRPTKAADMSAQDLTLTQALVGLQPEDASPQRDVPLWSQALLATWLSQQLNKRLDARAAVRRWRQWGWEPTWPEPTQVGAWQGCIHGPLTHGVWLMCLRSPRQSTYWLSLDHAPQAQDYLNWLQRLLQQHRHEPLRLELDFPGTEHVQGLSAWLSQHPTLTLLTPRRPHEDTPTMNQAPTLQPTLTAAPPQDHLTHMQRLEAESIHILREVVANCRNPVMLYSIGKDSACMLHLARKAFHPAPLPFALLHVDTGWKFREMYAFREKMQAELGFELLVHQNPEGLAQGINPFTHGSQIHTDIMKTQGLRQALDQHQFDAAFGGARRDEEKSRAKERIFSFRTANHHWDPKNQRPELWNLYNTHIHTGESLRVFPLSNWTELDVWLYIHQENIPVVPLYFAKERPVVERHGTLIMVDDERMPLHPGEVPLMRKVRFRTLGCYPLTGAIESNAQSVPDIIREMLASTSSERQGRLIDHDGAASMEKKKQEGYF